MSDEETHPEPSATTPTELPDPWSRLRAATPARLGLGRAGDALPTPAVLELQRAQAAARAAIHTPLDLAALAAALSPLETLWVASAAPDRPTYLRRPELGRRLSVKGMQALEAAPRGADLLWVVTDGLSSLAVQRHAAELVKATAARLRGLSRGPVVLASQGRVALGDVVGERLGARMVVVVVGERPGLSTAESLGVYVTYAPRRGRQDSERNFISNIHPGGGLSLEQAAERLALLVEEVARLKLTGVNLKLSGNGRMGHGMGALPQAGGPPAP